MRRLIQILKPAACKLGRALRALWCRVLLPLLRPIARIRRLIPTILLALTAALFLTAAVFLAVDGNLARLTGWYRFDPGAPVFPPDKLRRIDEVDWMRIETLNDRMECSRDENGVWWVTRPFRDRMSPAAAQAILNFTRQTRIVDSLPARITRGPNQRRYGVATSPHTITLKVPDGDGERTTIARYTLGNTAPWLVDHEDGSPTQPTTYLRTNFYGNDDRIHVVSGNILSIFKSGLNGLRDRHPLQFDPDKVRSISISGPGADVRGELTITRLSAETDWNIVSPGIAVAEQESVAVLLNKLSSLSSLRVDALPDLKEPGKSGIAGHLHALAELTGQIPADAAESELPGELHATVRLSGEWGGEPLEIHFYKPFIARSGNQKICYATVSNRPVVFTLPVEARVQRRGSYGEFIAAVCSLPVLPENMLAQLKSGAGVSYVGDLPFRMDKLRSRRFTELDIKDISAISLRSSSAHYPLILRRIPGDAESQVEDTWLFSAAAQPFAEADRIIVRNFLRGLTGIPVLAFAEDVPLGGDMRAAMARFGLNNPDYVLNIQPNPCSLRATIFMQDLPLVRDYSPRTFLISRRRDAATGKTLIYGMEAGSSSIYQLSTKLTRSFSTRPQTWKNRHVFVFPTSALRKLTMDFMTATMELNYDYIGESWTGTLKGEDISARINPHRASYYVRQLQQLRAMQWLESDDAQALEALLRPVFSVKLNLELTDYSDIDAITVEQTEDISGRELQGNREKARELLSGTDDTDELLRDMAMAERATQKKTITLQIAPSNYEEEEPYFFGRIVETGELFMLSFPDAQRLGDNILD